MEGNTDAIQAVHQSLKVLLCKQTIVCSGRMSSVFIVLFVFFLSFTVFLRHKYWFHHDLAANTATRLSTNQSQQVKDSRMLWQADCNEKENLSDASQGKSACASSQL